MVGDHLQVLHSECKSMVAKEMKKGKCSNRDLASISRWIYDFGVIEKVLINFSDIVF